MDKNKQDELIKKLTTKEHYELMLVEYGVDSLAKLEQKFLDEIISELWRQIDNQK